MTNGLNTFNSDCVDGDRPYCREVSSDNYECAECNSACDCNYNYFCSIAPGQVGTCQKFDRVGKDCLPYQGEDLLNSSIPDSLKCAITFTMNSTNLAIDFSGFCVATKCSVCYPLSSVCSDTDGLKASRLCSVDGKLVSYHGYYWHAANYYENPTYVWWAVFFCFTIVSVVVEIIFLIFKIRNRGKVSTKKPNNGSEASLEMRKMDEPSSQRESTVESKRESTNESKNEDSSEMTRSDSLPAKAPPSYIEAVEEPTQQKESEEMAQ